MKITGITYGRTIVAGESFKQEKIWFGWDGEVEVGEDPDEAMVSLRRKADEMEHQEREMHHSRRRERRDR